MTPDQTSQSAASACSPAARILFADDQRLVRLRYHDGLAQHGFHVDTCATLDEILPAMTATTYDLLLLDLCFPDGRLVHELLPDIRAVHPGLPIVVVTASGKVGHAVACLRAGADEVLEKNDRVDELAALLHRLVANSAATAPGRIVPAPDTETGEPLWRRLATVAAHSDAPVVLVGETGSGKTRLARWIHDQGHRSNHSFVEVNCAGLDGDLLGTELFGHVRGAFTSADRNRDGLLATADGGTFFMDEIGALPERTQTRLLNLLEDGAFRPVGSDRQRRSNFRLICATQQPLAALVEQGTFRLDLYYRLTVLEIEIPPLRERQSELMPLFREFLEEAGISEPIDTHCRELLENHPWPGNIRELRNVAQRAGALRPAYASLCDCLRDAICPAPAIGATRATPVQATTFLGSLADMEQRMIQDALQETDGNISRAAELLGISRATLHRKLRQSAN